MTSLEALLPATAKPKAPPGGPGVRFTMRQYVLATVLEKAAAVVPRQDVMPVLKNFLITLDEAGATVRGTDLEQTVIAHTAVVDIAREGHVLMPAARLLAIVKEIADVDVVIDVIDSTTAEITAGSAHWTLRLPAEDKMSDYPLLVDLDGVTFHEIDRAGFLAAIAATRGAACQEQTRPNLRMLNVADGKMTACDGARLQQYPLGEDFPLDMALPINAVPDLLKILGYAGSSALSVGQSPEHLIFKTGGDIFMATKLVATFPAVEKTMLEAAMGNEWIATVDREELERAIRRTRIMADVETSAITLAFEDGRLAITARDKTGNVAGDELDVGWSGPAHSVVVNHRFVTDMLEMYDGPVATFKIGQDTGKRKAAVLLVDEKTGLKGLIEQMRAG